MGNIKFWELTQYITGLYELIVNVNGDIYSAWSHDKKKDIFVKYCDYNVDDMEIEFNERRLSVRISK